LGNPTEKFVELAKAAGVADLNLFKSDLESKKYFDRVQKDALEANALNLRGTPTVIFNDHVLTASAVEAMEAEAKQWYIVN
jgi:predicted DsbA family dithiol-disulfide isomerase